MRYRQIGNSGLTVSEVGLGCNNFGGRLDFKESADVINAAIGNGITFFDTADVYGQSEEFIGRALTAGKRSKVVLATKFGGKALDPFTPRWMARCSRGYIRVAVERSLRRLRTDWIDLYQIHVPDGITPIDETLEALTGLVKEGKVRYVGSSNFSAWQVADAEWTARERGHVRLISMQNRYNLLERSAENELLPAATHYSLGFIPYFPLANGLLTGKYDSADPPPGSRYAVQGRKVPDQAISKLRKVRSFAHRIGCSVQDLAFAWLLSHEVVPSVIAGATSASQVAEHVRAADHALAAEDLAELEAFSRDPKPVRL